MEDRLEYILSLVNEWLKFAETKNAALLAADSAAIFGILNLLKGTRQVSRGLELYLYFAVLLMALAGVSCLASFIPQLEIPWLAARRKPSEDDNLVFYGDIANYSPRGLLKAIYSRSQHDPSGAGPLEEDYAEQIVVNSRIALRKYRHFNAAVWLTVSAVLTPVVAGVFYLFREKV